MALSRTWLYAILALVLFSALALQDAVAESADGELAINEAIAKNTAAETGGIGRHLLQGTRIPANFQTPAFYKCINAMDSFPTWVGYNGKLYSRPSSQGGGLCEAIQKNASTAYRPGYRYYPSPVAKRCVGETNSSTTTAVLYSPRDDR